MALRRATFRLYPNKQVSEKLSYHRQLHKDLYNAAVSNRITSRTYALYKFTIM